MARMGAWDLLVLGLLVSPLIIGGVFLATMYGLLTVEIVSSDQPGFPSISPGDRVEVYGTWVRDEGHTLGDYGWNEIHPAVFLQNLDMGVSGGTRECRMLQGVHDPGRLRILDPNEPCKLARGKVQYSFIYARDGDLHLDLLLDPEYQILAITGPPLMSLSYPTALLLLATTSLGFGPTYLGVSITSPKRTMLGRLFARKAKD